MPAIDCHTHLFPPEIIKDRQKISSRDHQFAGIYENPKARMVDVYGLKQYMNEEEVEGAVVCGFQFQDPGLMRLANDYLLDSAASDERIIPFVLVNIEKESEALAEAQRCAQRGAKGIGELAFYKEGFGSSQRKAIETIARFAEESSLPFMIHTNEQVGHHYHGKTEVDFNEIVHFIEDHQGLDVILGHLGGGICFYEFMPEIRKKFGKVWYDLAAAPYLYTNEIYTYIAQFLADKVLFGSDFPLLTLKRYMDGLNLVDPVVREKILFENAVALIGLDK